MKKEEIIRNVLDNFKIKGQRRLKFKKILSTKKVSELNAILKATEIWKVSKMSGGGIFDSFKSSPTVSANKPVPYIDDPTKSYTPYFFKNLPIITDKDAIDFIQMMQTLLTQYQTFYEELQIINNNTMESLLDRSKKSMDLLNKKRDYFDTEHEKITTELGNLDDVGAKMNETYMQLIKRIKDELIELDEKIGEIYVKNKKNIPPTKEELELQGLKIELVNLSSLTSINAEQVIPSLQAIYNFGKKINKTNVSQIFPMWNSAYIKLLGKTCPYINNTDVSKLIYDTNVLRDNIKKM